MAALSGALVAQESSPTPDLGASLPGTSLPSRPLRSPGATATPAPQPTLRPAATRPAPSPAAEEMIQSLDFPGTEIRDVLAFYETLTGKKVLFDNTVQGKIYVRVLRPISKQEAIRILETAFALNNFTLIPGPGDIVKVINAGKNPRQFNIPILSDVRQLPEGNQVVSFLFKLNYADPLEVKTTLDQVVAPTPNLTSIVALPKSQAVLVTETADVIRNIAPIVARLDSEPAEVVSEFFQLQRADAKEVVERLIKMFEKTPSVSGAPQGGPGGQPNGAAGGMVTLSEDSLIVGKIRIAADPRTNRVQVVTRPVNLPFIRSLIAELDAGTPLGEPSTRPLRFVLAGDILDIVAGSVAEPGVEVKKIEVAQRTGGAANPVSNTSGNLGSNTGSSRGSSSRNSTSGITPGAFGSNRTQDQGDTAPEGRIIRNTKIIADNRINAIIVVGTDEMKRKVFKLLDQIDIRAPQVMLTAVIGELTLDNNEEFGIDYLFHKGNLGTAAAAAAATGTAGLSSALGLPGTVAGINRLTGGSLSGVVSAVSLPATSGVTALVGVADSFDVIVNALESTGRFRVTSRPMIFTSNNRPAVISSGESVGVPSSINSSYTTANTLVSNAQVDYIDVALKLSVLPLINSEGEVTLKISQEANNISGSTTVSGNDIPTVATRSIDTTVSVANQATIVLGGLVSEQKQSTKSGIPVLHRLPLVGPLFGSTKRTLKRTELIVLIRPTVTKGPVDAIKEGERALEKTNFPPDLDASLDPVQARIKNEPACAPPKAFALPKALLRSDE